MLVSPKAFESDWVARELKHGLKLQAERGRAAFPVILLALNGTKPGSLAGYFDETPAYIPVSSAPGGATAAIHDILVALDRRLPTDRPPLPQPRPEPVAELVLKLSDLRFHEEGGLRRAAGTTQLIYESVKAGQRKVESSRWRFTAPLGPIEAEDLSWYLERWAEWPNPVVADRARKVEANLKAWGEALHAAALPPEHTAKVLQAWAGVGENASRRFSVTVDASLVVGASDAETTTAQEAATAMLALPWELLHNGKGFLFQGARPVRVRRCLPNQDGMAVSVVAPPIRVLLISARPEDESCGYLDHRASALPLVAATEELGEVLRLSLLHPAPPTPPWRPSWPGPSRLESPITLCISTATASTTAAWAWGASALRTQATAKNSPAAATKRCSPTGWGRCSRATASRWWCWRPARAPWRNRAVNRWPPSCCSGVWPRWWR